VTVAVTVRVIPGDPQEIVRVVVMVENRGSEGGDVVVVEVVGLIAVRRRSAMLRRADGERCILRNR
jgi:hypothetical protein